MLEGSDCGLLPDALSVDGELVLDSGGGVDIFSFGIVEQENEEVSDFTFAIITCVNEFMDFPVQLEKHCGVRAIGELLVRPFLDVARQPIDVHVYSLGGVRAMLRPIQNQKAGEAPWNE